METGTLNLNIKGVELVKGPLESIGPYDLYTGYIVNEDDTDIPHYLVVHREYEVVETSSAVLALALEAMKDLTKRLSGGGVKEVVPDFRPN